MKNKKIILICLLSIIFCNYSRAMEIGNSNIEKIESYLIANTSEYDIDGFKNDPEAIKAFQNILNEFGYDCGIADGIWGNNTREAVEHYQKDYKLDITGESNVELLKHIINKITGNVEKEEIAIEENRLYGNYIGGAGYNYNDIYTFTGDSSSSSNGTYTITEGNFKDTGYYYVYGDLVTLDGYKTFTIYDDYLIDYELAYKPSTGTIPDTDSFKLILAYNFEEEYVSGNRIYSLFEDGTFKLRINTTDYKHDGYIDHVFNDKKEGTYEKKENTLVFHFDDGTIDGLYIIDDIAYRAFKSKVKKHE